MTFKDLKIGEIFEFSAKNHFNGTAVGPWKKTSERKYERIGDGMECRVGTVKVSVEKRSNA